MTLDQLLWKILGDHNDDDDKCKEGANINDNEPRKVWGSKYLPTVADNDTHVVKNCHKLTKLMTIY